MKKIKVVIDSEDEKRRRTVFWLDFYEYLDGNYNFEYISIPDLIKKGKNPASILFNKKFTDIIVINWHCINTDPVYQSNISHDFFHHYIPTLNNWLSEGGVLLVEAQCAGNRMVQTAYDPFTYDEKGLNKKYFVEVCKEEEVGQKAKINEKFKKFPLLKNLAKEIDLFNIPNKLYMSKSWFPKDHMGYVKGIDDYEGSRARLYSGYFLKYKKGYWFPLLFNEQGKNPVFLMRLVEGKRGEKECLGAIMLTTMYIASSGLQILAENIFNFSEYVDEYLKWKEKRKQEIRDLIIKVCKITYKLVEKKIF